LTSSTEGYGKASVLNYVTALIQADREAGGDGRFLNEEEMQADDPGGAGDDFDEPDAGGSDNGGGEEASVLEAERTDASTALPWIQKTLSHAKKKKGVAKPKGSSRKSGGGATKSRRRR